MKLYGSTTSPFVRRIRIVLASIDHEFLNLQIFSGADRELLASRNPTLKVPCLEAVSYTHLTLPTSDLV